MSLISYGAEHEELNLSGGPVGETQFERVQRLGREAEARYAAQMADFAEVTDPVPASVAGPFGPQEIANGRQ